HTSNPSLAPGTDGSAPSTWVPPARPPSHRLRRALRPPALRRRPVLLRCHRRPRRRSPRASTRRSRALSRRHLHGGRVVGGMPGDRAALEVAAPPAFDRVLVGDRVAELAGFPAELLVLVADPAVDLVRT